MAQQSAGETAKGLAGLIFLGFLAYLYFSHGSHKVQAAGTQLSTADATPATPALPYPPSEQRFLSIVARAAAQYNGGANDMAKGASRPARARALCSALGGGMMLQEPWLGTVSTLSTNGDGKGVLGITLAEGVTVTTTNNSFSDSLEHTLIDPSTNLFQNAVALHVGQQVRFRGTFLPSDSDCTEERSMTIEGSMTEPEFAMRFTAIQPAM